jgi:hypothetical protein
MAAIFIEVAKPGTYDQKVHGRPAYIRSPFAAKDAIKSLPNRAWDAATKRWVIPAADVNIAARVLREEGWRVEIIEPVQAGTRTPPLPQTASWADAMFKAIPGRLHQPVFRALTKVLHPDVGGDLVAMQQLTAAKDRAVAA